MVETKELFPAAIKEPMGHVGDVDHSDLYAVYSLIYYNNLFSYSDIQQMVRPFWIIPEVRTIITV